MIQTQTEALLVLINRLPEIDFVDVLKGMAEQIQRNKWEHIIDGCFDIDTHQEELWDAERELEKLEEKKDELIDAINTTAEDLATALDSDEDDELRGTVQEVIDKLNAIS